MKVFFFIGRLSTPQDVTNPAALQASVSFNEILKRFNANVPYSGLINAVTSEGMRMFKSFS